MKKKLKLDALKVQSFVTEVKSNIVKGAGTKEYCTIEFCIVSKGCVTPAFAPTVEVLDCVMEQVNRTIIHC